MCRKCLYRFYQSTVQNDLQRYAKFFRRLEQNILVVLGQTVAISITYYKGCPKQN